MPFMQSATDRCLEELRGVGPRLREDFDRLGVHSVADLARCDPMRLYRRLCTLTGARQDPCVYDSFRCAVEQARNPRLPSEQRNWWYWSRVRKAEHLEL
jgi:hypothetical protein